MKLVDVPSKYPMSPKHSTVITIIEADDQNQLSWISTNLPITNLLSYLIFSPLQAYPILTLVTQNVPTAT